MVLWQCFPHAVLAQCAGDRWFSRQRSCSCLRQSGSGGGDLSGREVSPLCGAPPCASQRQVPSVCGLMPCSQCVLGSRHVPSVLVRVLFVEASHMIYVVVMCRISALFFGISPVLPLYLCSLLEPENSGFEDETNSIRQTLAPCARCGLSCCYTSRASADSTASGSRPCWAPHEDTLILLTLLIGGLGQCERTVIPV